MKSLLLFVFGLITFFGIAQKSQLDLSNPSDFSDLELYAPHLESYKVFINGENHTYAKSNAELQLKMIKYLHQRAGVKNLLLELGWSRGYIITKYIQTGDTTLLPAIKSFSWKYYADLVEGLKQYNHGLPDSAKITVTGIDVERHYSMVLKALSLVLPNPPETHDSIAVSIESVHSAVSYLESTYAWNESDGDFKNDRKHTYSIYNTVSYLLQSFEAHQEKYLDLITPENRAVFLKIVSQLKGREAYQNYESDNVIQSYVYREKYMYDQFMELHQKDTTQKYFMQFGRCHSVKTFQQEACGWYGYKSIAYRINETTHSGLKGSVLSTGIYYPHSQYWSEVNQAEKKQIKEAYLDSSKIGRLTLWEVMTDSAFIGKNDFLIVNNKSSQSELDPKTKVEKSFGVEDDYRFGFLNLTTGAALIDRPALDQYLADSNFNAYDRTLFWGIELGSYRNNGLYYVLNFTSPIGKEVIDTKEVTVRVNTYLYLFNVGYDLLPHTRLFLIPYVGIGGSSVRLKYRAMSKATLLGEEIKSRATGANLNGLVGVKFQKESKGTIFGLDLKYTKDIGNPFWVANGSALKEGIQLNSQGLVIGGFLGFWF